MSSTMSRGRRRSRTSLRLSDKAEGGSGRDDGRARSIDEIHARGPRAAHKRAPSPVPPALAACSLAGWAHSTNDLAPGGSASLKAGGYLKDPGPVVELGM